MVRICNEPYPNNSKYEEHFELFSYSLSDFQKYAIEAIVEGHHVLTTAHTGSGKTLSAEFAIQYFVQQGKKVIYTSPIKALSNQKYYEFTRKYPHIQFGLMTGDIKTNPTADVLIMTTEILMNYLFNMGAGSAGASTSNHLSFQIDIQSELACVVFDEIHYINDEHRGHVWEQTILMLPPHIQMVMLSATIDAPEKFARWCETCKSAETDKTVYLASTYERVVPLTHYGFVAATEALFKSTKNKELAQKWRNSTNRIIKIQTEKGKFLEEGVKEIAEIVETLETKELYMKRKFVLNNLATYLKENEMLPAIAFVFSRKQVEMCAKEITSVLLEDDSKVPYIVKRECDQIIRKLPNHAEYYTLPEYVELVGLLEKGIGIHHSGMIPVLREIVELMISKGYIKLLFATESFAIGLDCPIRTAIFTGLTKFDGKTDRFLLAHEYTQMAGRAGRRGIDTIGYVIHCNNLFRLPSTSEYKTLLCGRPQTLSSKFHINYSMVLQLLKRGQQTQFETFANRSMIYNEIEKQKQEQRAVVQQLNAELENKAKGLSYLRTHETVCLQYLEYEKKLPMLVNKKRKEAEREMKKIQDAHNYLMDDLAFITARNKITSELSKETKTLYNMEQFIADQTQSVCQVLLHNGFISETTLSEGVGPNSSSPNNHPAQTYELTVSGKLAASIAEIHPLVIAELLTEWKQMEQFSVFQIVGLLSCFVDIKVPEEKRAIEPKTRDSFLFYRLAELQRKVAKYQDIEIQYHMYTGISYHDMLAFDIVDDMMEWAENCNDEESCKRFLQTNILLNKSISVGDFTKACLKISATAKEWINVAEQMGYTEWQHKCSKIDGYLLKYVATTQSLYV